MFANTFLTLNSLLVLSFKSATNVNRTTDPNLGNKTDSNDDIVAEITLKTLDICLFNVDIVVDKTVMILPIDITIEALEVDTKDNILDKVKALTILIVPATDTMMFFN